MIICEREFVKEDPYNKGYSLYEVDFYSRLSITKIDENMNHRLSLRKNLRTGNYEVYKFFYLRSDSNGNVLKEVMFADKDLQKVLDSAISECKKYSMNITDDKIYIESEGRKGE